MNTNQTTSPKQISKIHMMFLYEAAIERMNEAKKELAKIAASYQNWSSEDAKDYIHQIDQIISCDDGECGLSALLKTLENETGMTTEKILRG